MTIIEDTRQQAGKHDNIHDYMASAGIDLIRQKLSVGDYMVPSGHTSIDTKSGLQEVYNNLVGEHSRFRNELIRARDSGIHLIVLVEEHGIRCLDDVRRWKNPRAIIHAHLIRIGRTRSRPPISSKRLCQIMKTMTELYGVTWDFCDPEDTGQEIERILCEAALEELTSDACVKTEQSKPQKFYKDKSHWNYKKAEQWQTYYSDCCSSYEWK